MSCAKIRADKRTAIIMPVYNESDTIESTVMELHDVVSKSGNVDILVFEDGSVDGTKEILQKLDHEIPQLYVETNEERKGYPRAMRDAFLSLNPSTYEYVMSMDSDGQYDPLDFFKIWSIMEEYSPDIVMGRRIKRAEAFYRKFLSWGLRVLEGFMFPLPCKDVTSVMRLMRVETAQEIAEEVKYSKYNFWLEFTARMASVSYTHLTLPTTPYV